MAIGPKRIGATELGDEVYDWAEQIVVDNLRNVQLENENYVAWQARFRSRVRSALEVSTAPIRTIYLSTGVPLADAVLAHELLQRCYLC
jgi:ornithine cyclodeaminase/alanine dehydrogenase-like protein (mu-crystallin family)